MSHITTDRNDPVAAWRMTQIMISGQECVTEQAAVGAGCAMIAVSTLDVASMIYAVDIISGVRIASHQFSTDSVAMILGDTLTV